jgi:hypothetical protein
MARSFSFTLGFSILNEWEFKIILGPFLNVENVKNSKMLVRLLMEGQPY